jgi:hypothetical protein
MRASGFIMETLLTKMAITGDPSVESADTDVQLRGDGIAGEAFLEEKADGSALELEGEAVAGFGPARNPPRGVDDLLLYWLINFFIMHGNTPFNIGVSTIYPLNLVS